MLLPLSYQFRFSILVLSRYLQNCYMVPNKFFENTFAMYKVKGTNIKNSISDYAWKVAYNSIPENYRKFYRRYKYTFYWAEEMLRITSIYKNVIEQTLK